MTRLLFILFLSALTLMAQQQPLLHSWPGLAVPVPAQIAGLKLWLDADYAFATDAVGTAAPVWVDRSGNANHAYLRTNGVGKAWVTNSVGTNTASTRKAVGFFGTASSNPAGYQFGPVCDRPFTMFIVHMCPTKNGGARVVSTFNFADGAVFNDVNANQNMSYYFPPSHNVSANNSITYGSAFVFSLTRDTGTVNPLLYKNGALMSMAANNNADVGTWNVATNYLNMENPTGSSTNMIIAEVIVYNSVLSGTLRSNVEAYLNAKYTLW